MECDLPMVADACSDGVNQLLFYPLCRADKIKICLVLQRHGNNVDG